MREAALARGWSVGTEWKPWLRDHGVYVGVVLLIVVNTLISPSFLSIQSIRLQIIQVVPVAIVALGMTLVIGTRGIDLSVGSVMAIAASLLPLLLVFGPVVALAGALAAGALVGVLNGSLIAFLGIQPIVATLGMLVAGRGIALVIANGKLTELFDPTLTGLGSGNVSGIPILAIVTLGTALVVAVIVSRTIFGRQLVATGGNPAASVLAGVPVKRTLVTVYVACAVLAALAGVLQTARIKAADPSFLGNLIELSAITAVVVGGTPLSGGRIRILGTLAGALLMQLISATIIRNNLPDSTARMVGALIILGAVYIQRDRGN
jgi:ribose/xylose/arabinose/galactoside ABC-type transport system permease subunit